MREGRGRPAGGGGANGARRGHPGEPERRSQVLRPSDRGERRPHDLRVRDAAPGRGGGAAGEAPRARARAQRGRSGCGVLRRGPRSRLAAVAMARARWLVVGAYVGAIYGTLPYGPVIGRTVIRSALGAWLLGSGMGLVAALAAGGARPGRDPRRPAGARQRRIVSTKITASSRIIVAMKKPEKVRNPETFELTPAMSSFSASICCLTLLLST